MNQFLLALFCMSVASSGFARTYGVIYVHTGRPDIDVQSVASLKEMVGRLNLGSSNAGTGDVYKLIEVNYFNQALEANNNPAPWNCDMIESTVMHGIFDQNDKYTGYLEDSKRDSDGEVESTPDTDVDPFVEDPEHCNADGTVSTEQIGNKIAGHHHQGFPPPPATGSSGSSGGGSGSGAWTEVTSSYQYAYFDRYGTYWVTLVTQTTWIFSTSAPGANAVQA